MKINPVNVKSYTQNSPSQKGFLKFRNVKSEGIPRVLYTPCADEEFPEGGTDEQRRIIWEYYKQNHLFAGLHKPYKFVYHIGYPLEDTTLELQDAYYNRTLDKYPDAKAVAVIREIEGLKKEGWSGCSQSALDRAEADYKAMEEKRLADRREEEERTNRIVQNM